MNYTITKNEQFNSLEIFFDGKPSEAVRNALKGLKFRWHNVKACWYGYADEETTRAALDGMSGETVEVLNRPGAKKSEHLTLWERCDVSTIPEHNRRLDTKTICAEVRAHLKARFPECKFSIRKNSYSSISADILSSPYERKTIKGDTTAEDWRDRYDRKENSEELEAVLKYFDAYLQSYNYDSKMNRFYNRIKINH